MLTVKRESLGKRHPALLISVTLLSFITVLVAAGYVGYHFLHKRTLTPSPHGGSEEPDTSDEPELAVEHGQVVKPEELHGHGKLYFVPVGTQAISAEFLAQYYRDKFHMEVTVLPAAKVGPVSCVPERGQCVAEELEIDMTSAYPEIAKNPASVMIALTDEDIYPRELGWEFTYSLHWARIGIVSTRRMDPSFWGDPPNEANRLANTRQMLTKYVALMYFHVPESFDPTSIMYTPLTPDGGTDDLYESDLHSEESANGMRGTPSPCLYFTYSYRTHQVKPYQPVLTDCDYSNLPNVDEESFDIDLGWGYFAQRTVDLRLSSTPAIEFTRGYNSNYSAPAKLGFGWNANHTYNEWLSSDGLSNLTTIQVNGETGQKATFDRLDKGRGFNPKSIYESHDDELYGARLSWDANHYKLQYRDGSWATYLPCDNSRSHCYWYGYRDAKGNSLEFDRGPNQELRRLTASDHQGITFRSDANYQIIEARTTNGKHLVYEYDAAGCLARARRADGQITLYKYDSSHQMISVSVMRRSRAAPSTILTNKYDAQGRITRITLAGVGAYAIEYISNRQGYSSKLKVTSPSGERFSIDIGEDDYVVRAPSVRFAAAASEE